MLETFSAIWCKSAVVGLQRKQMDDDYYNLICILLLRGIDDSQQLSFIYNLQINKK